MIIKQSVAIKEDVVQVMSKLVMTKIVKAKTVGNAPKASIKDLTRIKFPKLEEDGDALTTLIEDRDLVLLQNTTPIETIEVKVVIVNIIGQVINVMIIHPQDTEGTEEGPTEVLSQSKMEILIKMVCLFQIYRDHLCPITSLQKCKTSKFLASNRFMNATKKITLIAIPKSF